jgi:hypothetical protein
MTTPRPFKNPEYTKNVNRRTKNLKNVLAAERERERVERERRRAEREERMQVDGEGEGGMQDEEDLPSCAWHANCFCMLLADEETGRYIHRGTAVGAATATVLRHYWFGGAYFPLVDYLQLLRTIPGTVHGSYDRPSVPRQEHLRDCEGIGEHPPCTCRSFV